MKYDLVSKNAITIFKIDERRMILDILDPVYKDILKAN